MSAAPEPKRRGRPPGSTIPPAKRKTKRIVVLVSAAQYEKSEALGSDWMREHVRDLVRQQIDRAKLP